MRKKEINLFTDHFGLELELNADMGIVVIRLNEFVLDEEKSTPECEFYKNNNKIEVYPDVDELKEIIKSLQQILPEDNENE